MNFLMSEIFKVFLVEIYERRMFERVCFSCVGWGWKGS